MNTEFILKKVYLSVSSVITKSSLTISSYAQLSIFLIRPFQISLLIYYIIKSKKIKHKLDSSENLLTHYSTQPDHP